MIGPLRQTRAASSTSTPANAQPFASGRGCPVRFASEIQETLDAHVANARAGRTPEGIGRRLISPPLLPRESPKRAEVAAQARERRRFFHGILWSGLGCGSTLQRP